jgi:hypothetical protein
MDSHQSTSQSAGMVSDKAGSSQPDYSARTSSGADQGREIETFFDKASDHKIGIAIGIAVGAVAAAAISLLFAGKSKSSDRRGYSAQQNTDHIEYEGTRSTGWKTTS